MRALGKHRSRNGVFLGRVRNMRRLSLSSPYIYSGPIWSLGGWVPGLFLPMGSGVWVGVFCGTPYALAGLANLDGPRQAVPVCLVLEHYAIGFADLAHPIFDWPPTLIPLHIMVHHTIIFSLISWSSTPLSPSFF